MRVDMTVKEGVGQDRTAQARTGRDTVEWDRQGKTGQDQLRQDRMRLSLGKTRAALVKDRTGQDGTALTQDRRKTE